MYPTDQRITRWLSTAFAVSALLGVGFFFIPAFIIRPFRYQSPRALWLAMAMRQRAPLPTLLSALLCLLLVLVLWRGASVWRKLIITIGLLLVCFSAVMARINYFEWMFRPLDSPQFEAQSQSKLDSPEMIIAVRFGNDARAYPIREMAYHHVLNDWVAGVPVAVTY